MRMTDHGGRAADADQITASPAQNKCSGTASVVEKVYNVEGKDAAEAINNMEPALKSVLSADMNQVDESVKEARERVHGFKLGGLTRLDGPVKIQDVARKDNGSWIATDVKICLPDIVVHTPEWSGYSTAEAGEKAQWERASAQLREHEKGHVRINQEGLAGQSNLLLTELRTIRAGSLAELQTKEKLALDRMVERVTELQNAYDLETAHGTSQTSPNLSEKAEYLKGGGRAPILHIKLAQ